MDANKGINSFKSHPAKTPHISIVIPVYKCEAFLYELYQRLVKSIETITSNFEIIMVEDYGKDRSWEIIEGLCKLDKRAKGIRFNRNFGQHYAITAGLDYCSGKWAIIMDADLQDRPEEIVKLYEKAQEGYDVVLAIKAKRNYPILQSVSSWLFYKVFNFFTDMNYNPRVGNYRIISRTVIDSYKQMREQLRFFGGLIDWLGFEVAFIEVDHDKRTVGKSSYNFKKRWKLATEAIIAYSDKPLKLAIQLGFIMAIAAFIYGVYIIYRALFLEASLEGWPSLIVSLYFIGGIIIAILGILGIYLGKTFDEVKKRPLYIISRLKNFNNL